MKLNEIFGIAFILGIVTFITGATAVGTPLIASGVIGMGIFK